jgi:hypothetical protein
MLRGRSKIVSNLMDSPTKYVFYHKSFLEIDVFEHLNKNIQLVRGNEKALKSTLNEANSLYFSCY